MDKHESAARFSCIGMNVILTQTDTTVGFLSQNAQKLYEIKSRPPTKPFIKVYKDFKSFVKEGNRVSKNRRNLVRRSKKTTFIIKNRSFRIARLPLDSQLFRDTSWFYSTSANKSSEKFSRCFCEAKADIIIEQSNSLMEKDASTLIKMNSLKRRRLR